MPRDIHLSGSETSILKTIGLSGAATSGKALAQRASDMETAELIDALDGLLAQGYVVSDRNSIRSRDDLERSSFRVNPACAAELRDALNPSRRRAREGRERRR